MKLRIGQHEPGPPAEPAGSWGALVGWFSEMVTRIDRGDLAGAAEAQAELERQGFKVTYRRRPRRQQPARA